MAPIQSAWFPLVARHSKQYLPNQKLASAGAFRKAIERVYYGSGNQSAIILPVNR